jgi:DNA (cytosine-5)-methyltransferase 1
MEVINELALFAGVGGGILGGHLLGWRTVCAVEWDTYAASVLVARQNDGILPAFPIWDDVQTFDGKPWRGIVDVVSGGFPCQDISAAGRGAGIDGEKSGMWRHMARIVDEVRPRHVFVENSPMLTSRGLGRVLGDLATMGYNAKWGVLGAIDAGAPHQRDRIWIVATDADSNGKHDVAINAKMASSSQSATDANGQQLRAKQKPGEECQGASFSGDDGEKEHVADANGARRKGYRDSPKRRQEEHAVSSLPSWWQAEPDVGRVADGVASRMDRLRAIGNGQVPAVARLAWETLNK